MNEIKFGIIGTGRMAATMMAAFTQLSSVKVLAVASESEGRADSFAKLFNLSKAYHSIDMLLADQDIDAVYIANATESHAKTTIMALKAGKAVLCEKPIATSEAESKQIEIEAKRAGKLCMEAMWTLLLPAYKRLFELHSAKSLGEPSHLYADFGYPTSPQAYPRLYSPTPGSGALLDRGVYPIALALKLFGGIKKVTGSVSLTTQGVDKEAFFQLLHTNDCYSQIAVSITALLQNRAVLASSGGSISLDPPLIGAEAVAIRRYQAETNAPSLEASGGTVKLKQKLRQSALLRRINLLKNCLSNEYHSWGANQYLPVLTHFCELYRAGKFESDVIPLSFSTQVLQVVEQVKKL